MSHSWTGDSYFAQLKGEVAKNLERAAIFLVEKVKLNLNTSQDYKKSTDTAISTRSGGKTVHRVVRLRKNKGVYFYGLDPSASGEFPHKLTGNLQRSITYEMADGGQRALVGSGVTYAKFLELGTSKMAPRPFLRPTLNINKDALVRIIATGKA